MTFSSPGTAGAPEGMVRVHVAGDGSCLYHAVGAAFAAARAPVPSAAKAWLPGPGYAEAAGNLRATLHAYCEEQMASDADARALCSLWSGASQETVPCTDEGRAALLRRIAAPAEWAHYEEFALLARMLECCICVHHADGERFLGQSNCVDVFGADQPCARGRPSIAILCTNSEHFDALVHAAAGAPR